MTDPARPSVVKDPQHLAELLRQCVQCGLCLPHCATWLATGNEVQSPRGRLLLLGEMLAPGDRSGSDASEVFLQAFDQCIGCRACETACPSGVPFSLLEYGQQRSAALPLHRAGAPGQAVPGLIMRRMDRPGFLSVLSRVGDLARGLLRVIGGKTWRRRWDNGPAGMGKLVRLVGSLPTSYRTDADLIGMLDRLSGFDSRELNFNLRVGSESPGIPVAFFQGCANAGLLGATSRRLRKILVAAGCVVNTPGFQDCCGALAAHTGRPGRAADLNRRNREAFAAVRDSGTVIVAEAAGCGHELKKYGGEFETGVIDAVVLLARLELPALGPIPIKVVYHDPCHARHGQGIVAEPRQLLAAIPELELVEPEEPDVCCGSGGAWGLRYPEISADLGRRKAANLAATGADLVVTSNPGCQGQIADSLRLIKPNLPLLPLTDLLWYAAVRGQQNSAQK